MTWGDWLLVALGLLTIAGAWVLSAWGIRHQRRRVRRVAQQIADGLRDGSIVPDPPLHRGTHDAGAPLARYCGLCGDTILNRPTYTYHQGPCVCLRCWAAESERRGRDARTRAHARGDGCT